MRNDQFQLRAVIFDFDGVLYDTEPLHYRAFAEALPAFDLQLSEADYFERYLGLNDRTLTARLLADHGREPASRTIEALLARKDRAYMTSLARGLEPLPGVRAFVETLAGRLPLAVCSGARRVEIETLLRAAGLLGCFPVLVTCDDQPLSKPHPAGYLQALGALQADHPGLGPGGCLVVEDSPHGVQAARAAGMKVAAVAARLPPSRFPDADWIVSDIPALHRRLIEQACL